MKRVASWRVVEEKVKRKLNLWKQRSLSIRGRLTLIKSVLNSLSPLFLFLVLGYCDNSSNSREVAD